VLPIEEIHEKEILEKIVTRKVTSASSKESKDSGCPTDSIISEQEPNQHKGDGDQAAYNESTDDEDQNELDNDQIITESSEMHVIEAVVNEERPHTPELCLTGVAMTKQETVRKIQTKAILDELSSSNKIAKTVQSPSGAVAYTFGETGDFGQPRMAPSRLPPIVRKSNSMRKKSLDRETIEGNLQKAQHNKQKQLEEYRQKLILREERRKNVLERKRANMNLTIENDQQVPMPSARRRHTDEELIAPSSFDLDE